MKGKLKLNGFKVKTLAVTLALALGAAALIQPGPAQAHCDSINGPVVGAAKEALAQADVRLVLPYIQPAAEAELTAIFNQVMEVRKLGGASQQLAETYFFETTVRLHRVDEGAVYTGLQYESDFGPALTAAEQALETSSVRAVTKMLEDAAREGVATKFDAVREARDNAGRLGTVEAQHERAEAELIFEKYVLAVYEAATGEVAHGEGQATAGHGAEMTAGPAAAGHAETLVASTSSYPDWH